MTDIFHRSAALGLGEPGCYLALPGMTALLGPPFFGRLFLFFLRISQFFLSFLLVTFVVEYIGDIESNLSPGSDRRVRVFYSNIRGLLANLDELAVA